ncbi:unnamed protein product [Linum tenue]|uniref:H15 domain-containing protein n=2 Tax=Linum tenue TaxID=586396 RepID=A0AAV0I6S7_9ROSI|nr:unnamed protein product [Linum tenue]
MAEKTEEQVQGPVPAVAEAEQVPPVAAEEKIPVGEDPPAEEEAGNKKEKKREKKTKLVADAVPKEKKNPKQPKSASHPPYFQQMIKDALLALNEKSGSSPYAIAKFMEEKHKAVLPANFRKTLAMQLKNSAAKGKLVKIRASYKLSESGKEEEKSRPKIAPTKAAIATATATAKKSTATVTAKPKKPRTKTRSVNKPETGKKTPAALKPKKSTPAKVKQPRSIRSPAARRAKKASAAAV